MAYKNIKIFKNGKLDLMTDNYVNDMMSLGQIIVQAPMSKDDALEVLQLMKNPKEFYQNAFITSIFPFLSSFCYINSDDISTVIERCMDDAKRNIIVEKSKLKDNFINFIIKYQKFFYLNMKIRTPENSKNIMINMEGYNTYTIDDDALASYDEFFEKKLVKEFFEDYNLINIDYKEIKNYILLNKNDTYLYTEFLFDVEGYNNSLTMETEDEIRVDVGNLLDEIVNYPKYRGEQL